MKRKYIHLVTFKIALDGIKSLNPTSNFGIFTSITRLPLCNVKVLFSVKIFDVEFSPDLYALRSIEYKKVVGFENWSVRAYVTAR